MTDDKIRKNLFIDKRGALGFSALRLWPLFRLVFRFLHLKCACFSNLGISGGFRFIPFSAFGFLGFGFLGFGYLLG